MVFSFATLVITYFYAHTSFGGFTVKWEVESRTWISWNRRKLKCPLFKDKSLSNCQLVTTQLSKNQELKMKIAIILTLIGIALAAPNPESEIDTDQRTFGIFGDLFGNTNQCRNCRYSLSEANYCCNTGRDRNCCRYTNNVVGGSSYDPGHVGGSSYDPGHTGGKIFHFFRKNSRKFWSFR